MQASSDTVHLLHSYHSLSASVLESCEEMHRKGASPDLERKIKETFDKWVNFCEENQKLLFTSFNQLECEDAYKVSSAIREASKGKEFHEKCEELQERLNTVMMRAIQSALKPAAGQASLLSLPLELLRLNFALLPSLKDIFSWSRTSRQFRAIAYDLGSWKTSRAFQRILKESPVDLERKNFRGFLLRLGHRKETKNFATQLACEFFNNASDEVLQLFLNSAKPAELKQFFVLIEGGALKRESLTLSGSHWIHQEPMTLTWLVSKLPDLKKVSLSGNASVTDENILALAPLSKLKVLQLSGCKNITGKGLESLSISLEKLELSDCVALSPVELQSVKRFKNLMELNLSKNHQLQDIHIQFLSSLPGLTTIDLSQCIQMTDDALQYFAHLGQSLQTLNVSELLLRGDGLQHLAGLERLSNLNLNGCSLLQDIHIVHLQNLIAMRKLSMTNCKSLTGACFSNFKRMGQLTHLSCRRWKKFEEGDLNDLGCLEKLEELDLGNCDKLKPVILSTLGFLTQLRTLKLDGCDQIDASLLTLLLPLKDSLQHLDLSCCPKIGKEALSKMGALQNLRSLQLSGCERIVDADLASLNTLTQLRTLGLAGLPRLTGAGFQNMAACVQLTSLDLSSNENFSAQNIPHLKALMRLRELNLTGCPFMTAKEIEGLRNETRGIAVTLMVLRGKELANVTLYLDPIAKSPA